ncbi:MAG: acetate--CoA ligase family protein [Spirochaetales bacterium]|nr:acetate--CoA ligase family protein [Spirochaetales bacterium]
MKLFEYQAKEIFQEAGIPVPKAVLIEKIGQLDDAAAEVGFPCVLKSQVLQGGRGKAGLIQVVNTADEAKEKAQELFASPAGVRKILLEEVVDISQEIYLSVTVDPLRAKALVIASAEGGVEIETLAQEAPEKIHREYVDITTGMLGFQSKDLAFRLGIGVPEAKKTARVVEKLFSVFTKFDAELAEINPLFISRSGDVIAGDGKLVIDDNSLERQTRFERNYDYFDSPTAYEAAMEGIPYLQFDGDISLMCAGAGLTTTVYDLINYEGGSVANYLEFGGPNYRKAVRAMELCLQNESKVILVVTFGTIARADVMAEGIVDAIERLKPDRPIVTCIRGTNEEEAVEILKRAGLEPLFDTEEAVRKAVDIAKKAAGKSDSSQQSDQQPKGEVQHEHCH